MVCEDLLGSVRAQVGKIFLDLLSAYLQARYVVRSMHHHVLLVCIERSSVRDTHTAKTCKTNIYNIKVLWLEPYYFVNHPLTFEPASGPTLVLPPRILHAVVEKILTTPTIRYIRVGSNADFLNGLRCWMQSKICRSNIHQALITPCFRDPTCQSLSNPNAHIRTPKQV